MRINLTLLSVFLFMISSAQYNYGTEDFESFKRQKQVHELNRSTRAVDPQMENYDVKYMNLDLFVSNTSTFHRGKVGFKAEVVNNPLQEFVFELKSHQIDSIVYNNQDLEYERNNDLVRVELPEILEIANVFDIEVYYRGLSSGNGMSYDSSPGVVWTLSESFHAKDWFPVKQDLRDKIDSVDISITVPEGLMAGSNGLLKNIDAFEDGSKRFNWETRYPMVYYLISLAVSDYTEYNIYAHPEGTTDSLLIQNFVYNSTSYLNAVKSQIDATADLIELFSEKFSLYPFMDEKYGHCSAPIGGGMEHQTMTTISNFGFELVAHELGHMWFGDNVTCATWQDIWINEGFASYTEYIAHEFLNAPNDKDIWMQYCHAVAMENPDGSVYIPFEDAIYEPRIFSHQLSYKKGAAIIHMLRFELNNDDLFFDILSEYQIAFTDSVATGDDFKTFFEDMSGLDLTNFFDQWYYGEGYPTYDIHYYQENDTLYINSEQSVSSSTPLFQNPMEYSVSYSEGDSIIRVNHQESVEDYKIYFPYEITNFVVDPHNWVINGNGSITVGLKDIHNPKFEIELFPNPTNSNIQISISGIELSNMDIELLDVSGKTLKQFQLEQLEQQIDLKDLNEGVYFVKIKSEDHFVVRKVIKQ